MQEGRALNERDDAFGEWDDTAGQMLVWSAFLHVVPREVARHERERTGILQAAFEHGRRYWPDKPETEKARQALFSRAPVTATLRPVGGEFSAVGMIADVSRGSRSVIVGVSKLGSVEVLGTGGADGERPPPGVVAGAQTFDAALLAARTLARKALAFVDPSEASATSPEVRPTLPRDSRM